MAEQVVTTKAPAEVANLIESLGDVLAGNKPDPHHIADAFWSAFAHSLAMSVHAAFIAKSQHGKDELGQSWPDLDPKTKAYSRPDARKGLPLYKGKPTEYGNTHRPTLSPSQDKQWRAIFVSRLAFLRTQMSEDAAMRQAAILAWSVLKSRGATTILDYAKNRTVLLLQRSGRLEKSLRPGSISGDLYSPPDGQVFRRDKNSLTWGTAVEYANRVSVKRPLWPKNIDVWIRRGIDAGVLAIIKKLKESL
jgi:hypothetical protein